MNTKYVYEPVGLEPVKDYVNDICNNPMGYRRGVEKPHHVIVNLDAGNGQTTVTEYITNSFVENRVRHFGGLDTYLEFSLDEENLGDMYSTVESAAVFMNEYAGIIAMNVERLAEAVDRPLMDKFLREIGKMAENATLIFYVPSVATKNMCTFVKKLRNVLGDTIKMIQVEPYTEKDMVDMVNVMLEEAGMEIENADFTNECIANLVGKYEFYSAKIAKAIAQKLIKVADYHAFSPVISYEAIDKLMNSMREEKKEGNYEK